MSAGTTEISERANNIWDTFLELDATCDEIKVAGHCEYCPLKICISEPHTIVELAGLDGRDWQRFEEFAERSWNGQLDDDIRWEKQAYGN